MSLPRPVARFGAMVRRLRWLVASLVVLAPAGVLAQVDLGPENLPGTPRRTFVAPGRAYALEVPIGWQLFASDKDPTTLELRFGDQASLFIRRLKVPKGAAPRQLLLNALEQRLRKLPAFQEVVRRDVKVAGSPAAVVSGTYRYQGNAEFPRTVEDLFVVRGEEAFAFHFDAFEGAAGDLAAGLELVYRSFVIRPPGAGGEGQAPRQAVELPVDPDRIPY